MIFKEFTNSCYPSEGDPIRILYPDSITCDRLSYYDFDISYFIETNGEIRMNRTDYYPVYYPKGSKWCYEYEIIEEYLKEHGFKF